MKLLEVRTIQAALRADVAKRTLEGHAAVFGQECDFGWFRERIDPHAFDGDAITGDIRALFNHDRNQVLGRTSAKTLRVWVDEKGLAYRIDLPDTQLGHDLAVSVDRGDISQSSFAFWTVKEDVLPEKGRSDLRILKRVLVDDVSPVTVPAYTGTDVSARALMDAGFTTPEQIARHLEEERQARIQRLLRRVRMARALRGAA